MGQNGVPVGDQGRKRKTEPTLRELQQQLHTQKRQRITHPRSRRFIGGMDQPVLFELKITCEMMQFVLTLSPEDSLDYGAFTYDMTVCKLTRYFLYPYLFVLGLILNVSITRDTVDSAVLVYMFL